MMPPEMLAELEAALGTENVSTDPIILDSYAFQPFHKTEPGCWIPRPVGVVLPGSTPEVQETVALRERDIVVQSLTRRQDADGSWAPLEGGGGGGLRIRSTAQALVHLGYLGFDLGHPAVRRGAGYLFGLQEEDGSWQEKLMWQ